MAATGVAGVIKGGKKSKVKWQENLAHVYIRVYSVKRGKPVANASSP